MKADRGLAEEAWTGRAAADRQRGEHRGRGRSRARAVVALCVRCPGRGDSQVKEGRGAGKEISGAGQQRARLL